MCFHPPLLLFSWSSKYFTSFFKGIRPFSDITLAPVINSIKPYIKAQKGQKGQKKAHQKRSRFPDFQHRILDFHHNVFYIFGVSFTPPSLHQFNIEIALHRYVAQLTCDFYTHIFLRKNTYISSYIYILQYT